MVQMGRQVELTARRQIDAIVRSSQAIAASSSLEELNQALLELPSAPQLHTTVRGSVQSIRSDAHRQPGLLISQLESEARSQRPRLHFGEVMTALRMIAMSLLLMVVFAAMAMGHPGQGSWLEQFHHQRWQRHQHRWRRRLKRRGQRRSS